MTAMPSPTSPPTVTTDGSSDPLGYLNPLERALCGWAVQRAFALRTPRFMTVLSKYGPEGAAFHCCIKTFYAYCFPLVVAGFVTALNPDLSHFFFAMLGISWVLGTRRIFSLHRAGQEYRQSLASSG
jgi:hypothetical protein